jgi:hypothetical protein
MEEIAVGWTLSGRRRDDRLLDSGMSSSRFSRPNMSTRAASQRSETRMAL